MSANIPNDPIAIQKFFTSRDNYADANTFVGEVQRLWYNPDTNCIYVSDGETPGGIPVDSCGEGLQGVQGLQGIQGQQGIQGPQGLDGAFAGQGIQGIQGFQGTQGLQGNTGIQGVQGTLGLQGTQGIQGLQGRQGLQGLDGAFAGQGIQGVQGRQGLQGIIGFPQAWLHISSNTTAVNSSRYIADTSGGTFTVTLPASPTLGYLVQIVDNLYPTGWDINNLIVNGNGETIADQPEDLLLNVAGVLVEFIYDGTTWLVTANLGPSGIQGTQGIQGLSGSYAGQGVQGSQGTTGTQGSQGSQGTQGLQGLQGIQGLQGVLGIQGTQGTQGTQGIPGDFAGQGIQGAQGLLGLQGTQGVQGLDGAYAAQGIQGTQGIQGVQSIQGLQGVNGIQGVQGINGAIGPYPTTLVTAATYTAIDTDYYIGVNRAGTVTITLPTPSNGNMKIIKDESGNAATYPITIAGTIDNDAGGATIQLNNGSITLIYRNGWRIV